MERAERQEQLLKEANTIKVLLDAAIARLPKVIFQYENRMTNIGPDSFDCYLGSSLNEHIRVLTNQYNFHVNLAKGLNEMIYIDEL